MRAHLTKFFALVTLCSGLAACAGNPGDYPSLALRPFENGPPPDSAPPAPPPIRPVTDRNRLIELRAAAANADSLFAVRLREADALARAAAGQSAESNARAAALVALAELDTQRGKTAGALAAIDALAAEAANTLAPDPFVTAAQTEIAATLAREDAAIARLWEAIGS